MENGGELATGDPLGKEIKPAVGEEELKLESVDAELNGEAMESADESKRLVRDSEDSAVFEEAAMDQESFYTPSYRHLESDSRDPQEAAFDVVESSEEFDQDFGEKMEDFDGGEALGLTEDGASAPQDNGETSLENGHKEFSEEEAENGVLGEEVGSDVSLVNEHTVMKSEEQAPPIDEVAGDEKAENGYSLMSASAGEVSLDAVTESMGHSPTDERGVYVDTGTGSKEQPSVAGAEQMVCDSIGSDSPNKIGLDPAKESKEQAPLDEMGAGTGTRSKEQPATEGVEEMVNGPLGLDSPSDNGHIGHTHRELVKPQSSLSEADYGITGRSYAAVVKEGTSDGKPTQAKADRSSSGSKSEISEEFDRESVLVEDLSESSSTDDEDRRSSSQPAPSAAGTAHPESSGGPPLSSRPAGLGSSASLLEPASRSIQQPKANGVTPQKQSQLAEEPATDDLEENDETCEKLQMIRVKFLRLASRLGQTPHNVVVAQVLYRLGLAEQLRRNTNRPGVFSFDRASVMAEQLEASGKEPLDFSCTIMVIGKTGAGKSATINSIFDEVKFHTDAFRVATKKVQDVVGTVQGIKVRIIDTPGLFPSSSDQWRNEKILRSVKKFISQSPPDIVLYFDRLDMQCRDYGDVPLLRSVTDIFGSSVWFNAIIVLTHAASAPPDGPNGTPLSYEMFVSQRSHVVQQAIRQAAHDLRLMNPVSLVENHSACRMNRAGQRVLPNGQVWKPHLLLLSFASKILAEANMLLRLQDAPPGRSFGARARAPPLPFFLSSLLQSRTHLKLPEEQFGDDFSGNGDLDDASDSDDGSEYDELPPLRALNKSQLAKLSKAQKKAYFEELDYREKLLFRKQLKEERRRRRLMKKMAEEAKDSPNEYNSENVEDGNTGPASVPVPMPDLALPTSFDSDIPTHRYRFLDTSNQWVVRPVLENHVWDHDVGFDGLNVERLFAVKGKIPVSISGQLTKDKKECTFQMELASSINHGDAGATSLGLDMQTVGKDTAYTLRGETRVKNFRRNNTAAGISLTHLGDAMSAGVKIEDNLAVNKRIKLLMSGGAMSGRGDIAYGGRLEATLRDKDYPIGRTLSTLALYVVDWHGDLAIGCNFQSQIPVGRGTNVVSNANVNNKGTGQVGIRLNSSDQLQIALLALLPIFRHVKRMLFGSSQLYD